ncbi:MAG: urease accessory protein UreD [Alphaproteobacteria bacterium]
MYGGISPSDRLALALPLSGVCGMARIGYAAADGVSRLAILEQQSPLRVLFPRPAAGDPPVAALVTTSGGLVGGDRLDVAVTVGRGARLLAVAQAAEKVYRSLGSDCAVEIALDVADGAWLEWLPQETILFEGARLRRNTALDVAGNGRALAGEMLVFGRVARGETMTYGLVRDGWTVRRDGRLAWADALHMDEGDIPYCLNATAGFAGARAYATAIYVGPDAAVHRGLAREAAASHGVRSSATLCGPVLIARWLGREPADVRRAFGEYWMRLRAAAGGLAPRLPRLWHV